MTLNMAKLASSDAKYSVSSDKIGPLVDYGTLYSEISDIELQIVSINLITDLDGKLNKIQDALACQMYI